MESLPEIGDVLDDTYELVGLLGRGGFGAVYRARQLHMDRDVALKLLIASGAKFDEMVKRFRREVMAIRNLTHPNTIRIYDFRDNPDGLLYYTMEALEGHTLEEELEHQGPISPRRLKPILHQVCKSLAEAHSYNIIHRDLKPSNIMLVDMHGETDFVKVLDFGIAKMLEGGGHDTDDELEELTSAGMLVGTIRYMAPEQIAEEELGPHTDLYTLGLITVEMLTGTSVFTGSGRWEVLQEQVSDEPIEIPSPVLTSGLGPLVARCLHKEPEGRFSSAEEAIEQLESVGSLSDEPLYVRGEFGEWVPRTRNKATVPAEQTVEHTPPADVHQTRKDEFDAEKTEVTPVPHGARAGDGDGVASTEPTQLEQIDIQQVHGEGDSGAPAQQSGTVSTPDDPESTLEMSAVPSEQQQTTEELDSLSTRITQNLDEVRGDATTQKMEETISAGSDARSPDPPPTPGVDPPVEARRDEVDETGPQPLESRLPEGLVDANRIDVPRGETTSIDRRMLLAATAGIGIVAIAAVLAWLVVGDEPEESGPSMETAEVATGETDPTPQPPQQDEPPPSIDVSDSQEFDVKLQDPSVDAELFVDGEPRGETPTTLQLGEDAAMLRVDAEGHESLRVELDVDDLPEEMTLELEPIDDGESEPATARRETDTGESTSASGSPAGAEEQRQETSAPKTDSSSPDVEESSEKPGRVEADDEERSEESEDDTSSGWIDVTGHDETAEESDTEDEEGEDEEAEVPLF